jgi:hypothetical protein
MSDNAAYTKNGQRHLLFKIALNASCGRAIPHIITAAVNTMTAFVCENEMNIKALSAISHIHQIRLSRHRDDGMLRTALGPFAKGSAKFMQPSSL